VEEIDPKTGQPVRVLKKKRSLIGRAYRKVTKTRSGKKKNGVVEGGVGGGDAWSGVCFRVKLLLLYNGRRRERISKLVLCVCCRYLTALPTRPLVRLDEKKINKHTQKERARKRSVQKHGRATINLLQKERNLLCIYLFIVTFCIIIITMLSIIIIIAFNARSVQISLSYPVLSFFCRFVKGRNKKKTGGREPFKK